MDDILASGKPFSAYAVVVDLNGFTSMVRVASEGPVGGQLISSFVGDSLAGAVSAIESSGGSVVGIMGDAILGFVPEGGNRIFETCVSIAKDLDRMCEYISAHQQEFPADWHWSPGGPSLKISVEWGRIDVSNFSTRFLGRQKLYIGSAINVAARIAAAGRGNRCHIGPAAAALPDFGKFVLSGPHRVSGKGKTRVRVQLNLLKTRVRGKPGLECN